MSSDFPRRLVDLTTSWLSEVIREDVLTFESANVGAGKGMLGDIFRIDIALADSGRRSIIVKFAADREDLRAAARRSGVFEREVNFYRHVAVHLRCRIPKCHGSWFDPDTSEFLIVMEYIDADPAVNQIAGISRQQAEMVVRELASLHVPAHAMPSIAEYAMPAVSPGRRTNQRLFVNNGWERLRNLLPEKLRAPLSSEEMGNRLVEAMDHLARQPAFLLHGDARPDNLLFSRDGTQVALIDWQGLMIGPREWDLGYFFSQGLRIEDRRAWTTDLLDLYIEMASIGHEVNKVEMMENIGRSAWFSFGVACSLFTVADGSSQQTIDLAASMGERSLSLLFDHREL